MPFINAPRSLLSGIISYPGVLKDERIELIKDKQTIALRRVAFYHTEQNKVYEFYH